MKQNVRHTVTASIFAALIFVATYLVKVPMPSAEGYVHIGDSLVFLSGIALPPFFAAAAAGIGGALSDVLGGYALWAPWTFFIKALSALCLRLIWQKRRMRVWLIGGVLSAVIVNLAGYYLATLLMFSNAIAIVSLWENMMQEAVGVLLFFIMLPFWQRWNKSRP